MAGAEKIMAKPMKSQTRGQEFESGLDNYEQDFASDIDDGVLDI
jgi:hypothetical protein